MVICPELCEGTLRDKLVELENELRLSFRAIVLDIRMSYWSAILSLEFVRVQIYSDLIIIKMRMSNIRLAYSVALCSYPSLIRACCVILITFGFETEAKCEVLKVLTSSPRKCELGTRGCSQRVPWKLGTQSE